MGRRGPAHPGQGVGRHQLDDWHGVRAMACAREHGQADGVAGGDGEGQVRLGPQSPLRTPLQDAAGGELLQRRQEHGIGQARPLENRKRPFTVESVHQLALRQLERGLPRGGGGTLAHLSGLLGLGGQQYRRRPTACHGARSGVPAPRPGRGVL